MHKLIPWSEDLDLSDFYAEASRRGFVNNSSQKAMIDCFRNEREWNAWILYDNDRAVGSVAAHSFDDIIPGGYRILTRVCTFAESRPMKGLIKAHRLCAEHQNLNDQFLLPQCIEWVDRKGPMYATSNSSKEASQRLVHTIYFPTLEKAKIVTRIGDIYYRNTHQTLWQIHPDKFLDNLKRYPRWI